MSEEANTTEVPGSLNVLVSLPETTDSAGFVASLAAPLTTSYPSVSGELDEATSPTPTTSSEPSAPAATDAQTDNDGTANTL